MPGIDIPFGECLAFGLDLGLFLICRALLRRHREILKDIKEAPKFDSYADLRAKLSDGDDDKNGNDNDNNNGIIPYAVIEGRVEPLDSSISSQYVSGESGVIKTFAITDHKVERRSGLWHEKSDNIQQSTRDVPFKIVLAKDAILQSSALLKVSVDGVEFRDLDKIDNPLKNELDVVYDHFEPSAAGFGQAIMDNFRGDVSKGIQETEKMLLVGTKVTAIGKILLRNDGIRMVYPSRDFEFILTKKTYEEIVHGYREATGVLQIVTYVLGATGVFLVGLIGHRLFKEFMERRQYAALLRQLSEQRRSRVSPEAGAGGDVDGHLPNSPTLPAEDGVDGDSGETATSPVAQCIVCMTNPRDVILLSCGHVCVCHDCAGMLPNRRCPMCRSSIERVQAFYIA